MIISILGLVVVIVSTYHVYKTARDNDRNGVLWALLTFAVGIGTQWVLPVIATLVLVVWYIMSPPPASRNPYAANQQMDEMGSYAMVFTVLGLVASFIGMWLIMRFVSRIPDDIPGASAPPPPPPPPTFEANT